MKVRVKEWEGDKHHDKSLLLWTADIEGGWPPF